MDINAILPLLLGKTDLKDKTQLLSALASGGKPEDILAGALPPEAGRPPCRCGANKRATFLFLISNQSFLILHLGLCLLSQHRSAGIQPALGLI